MTQTTHATVPRVNLTTTKYQILTAIKADMSGFDSVPMPDCVQNIVTTRSPRFSQNRDSARIRATFSEKSEVNFENGLISQGVLPSSILKFYHTDIDCAKDFCAGIHIIFF